MAICQFCNHTFKSNSAGGKLSGMSEKLGTETLAVLLLTQVLLLHMETLMVSVNIHEQIEEIPEDQDAITPSRLARVDEVPDETAEYPRGCYLRSFPGEKSAGLTYGEAKLPFQAIHDEQVLQGADIFGPFESEEEWDLAKWLIKNVGHTQAEKFLKQTEPDQEPR